MPIEFSRVRTLILVALICSTLSFPAFSQGRLELFQGGVVSASLKAAGPGLGWISGSFQNLGAGISQLHPGAESIRWNPAGLAWLDRSQVYSEWLPPLRFDLNRFFDLQREVNSRIRQQIERYADTQTPVVQDARLQPTVLLDGGQGNYAAAIRTRRFGFGGAVHAPMLFSADLTISGLKVRALTQTGNGGSTIRFLGLLSGTLNARFELTGLSFAIGRSFGQHWGFGVGFDSFGATLELSGFFKPEALVSSGSEEFAFNDPAASHTNRLQASLDGQFHGEGGRWRLGFGYHLAEYLALDAALFMPATLSFSGSAVYTYDEILAFNLDSDPTTPFLDANILLEEQYTGTHPRFTRIDGLQLRLPGQVAVAVAWHPGKIHLGFTLADYFRPMGMDLNYFSGGDSTAVPAKGRWFLGITPKKAFYAQFGFAWAQLRIGAVEVEARTQNPGREVDEREHSWLPLVGVSGGLWLPHFDRFRLDYDVSLGVTSFLRLATSYHF